MTVHDKSIPASVLTECPCCSGALSEVFYEVGPVPVHSCLMLDSAEAAAEFPSSHVHLALCEHCGFVTNVVFDTRWSAYDSSYEDQQSYSPTFNAFADGLAKDLIERHGLQGKKVVEVGCSKGDFLRSLCEFGAVEAVGIDPSVLPGRIPPPTRGSMRFVQEYYGPQHVDLPADLITCRHTLEHIQDVDGTLKLMYRHAARNPGSVLMIEVPDATRVWKDCAFEDVYYEHCSYFTAGSLARAVRRAGFAVTDLRRDYGDQYLVIEASTDPSLDRSFEIEETAEETCRQVRAFAERAAGLKSAWASAIDGYKASGRTVSIWGSGSKCVAFLKTVGLSSKIDALVDINPHRAGRFPPGLGTPIQQPEGLRSLEEGLIIVMNPIYRDEIASSCRKLGLSSSFLALGDLQNHAGDRG